MVASVSHIVEVNPARGNDAPRASPHQPYKTLTAALASLQGGGMIKLAAGTYSKASGEQFPITVGDGVILQGAGENKGQTTLISGGGAVSRWQGLITLVLSGNAQLRGVRVHNSRGSGILVVDGGPLIRACHISRCPQDGIVVLGPALPQFVNILIEDNGGSAIQFADQSKGIVKDCVLLRCQRGIHIKHAAAPLVHHTQVTENRVGMLVEGSSRPVLRKSRIFQNLTQGIWLRDNSRLDLGQPQDPAQNVIRGNGQADIRNDTNQVLVTVGNDLLPQGLQGRVTLEASQVPSPEAIPPSLLVPASVGSQPALEEALPPGTPEQPPAQPPPISKVRERERGESRFLDVRGHWAAPYIDALAEMGLVRGYNDGLYRPNEAITRAQFAAMVAASFRDLPMTKGATPFVDLPQQHWASNAVALTQRQGFMGGYPDQTFRPDQPMARAQAIVAIAQGLKLAPAPANVLSIYRDRAQIPSYATDAIAAATRQNLVIDHPGTDQLRPLEVMTRAEVAALIYQGLIAQGRVDPLTVRGNAQPEMTQGSFPDIETHWARDFIQGLLDRHLIRGYDDGQFHPNQPMTRAQFAAIVYGAFRPTSLRPARVFRDVFPNHWAAEAIQRTYQGGFLAGFPDGSFGPDNAMLRVQTWVALVNGLNLESNQGGNLSLASKFVDSGSIPDYAVTAVSQATQLNMVVNAPDIQVLNPNRVATRAEASAVVYQTLVHLNQVPKVHNPFIVYP